MVNVLTHGHRPPRETPTDGMFAYIARRMLLMIPTLFGIMLISFVIVQFAPGGPVERVLAQLQGNDTSATSRIAGGGGGDFAGGGQTQPGGGGEAVSSKYRGAQGLDPAFIKQLEAQFGFDKPPIERFGTMLWNYLRFDFGKSYFRDVPCCSSSRRSCRSRSRWGCG